jgi:nanoRNase/pAp phosphatase (c-di-AMP/oligoRNAs hydrolase)
MSDSGDGMGPTNGGKKRLISKCDMDGLACGILLKGLGLVDNIVFAHPRDIENGKIAVGSEDITAGLPYMETAHLAFDHYPGSLAAKGARHNLIVDSSMPSTSRVICNHYHKDGDHGISEGLLQAVDKGFSADISIDEILSPTGWILLGYLIDQRTGLERYRQLDSTSAQLIERLMHQGKDQSIWEILKSAAVEERLQLYFSSMERCKAQLLRCTTVHNNLIVTDMRKEEIVYPGNRFLIYALFPECNVSMNVINDSNNRTSFVVGKSVIDRTYNKDIGKILKRHGGGGHRAAGTCTCDRECADALRDSLITELTYGVLENMFHGYFNCYTGYY